MVEEKEVKSKNTKKVVRQPKKVKPARGGLMKRTLKELEGLDIQLKDVFVTKGVSINLSWEQVIRLTNYNADKKVLRWDNTFKEALEIINIFLL